MNSNVSELCETCSETEDTNHFLFHCKKFAKEKEQLENRVEEILNGAGLNEVANIDLAVLVGMVENADGDTQSELIGALMEFIKSSKRFTKKLKRKQLIIRIRTSVTCVEHKESLYKGILKSTKWA